MKISRKSFMSLVCLVVLVVLYKLDVLLNGGTLGTLAAMSVVLPQTGEPAELIPAKDLTLGDGVGNETPAKSRQRGKSHKGPYDSHTLADMMQDYQKLKDGLSDKQLVKSFVHWAHEDIKAERTNRELGRMYAQFKAMSENSQFILIRSVAQENSLGFIPTKAGLVGLAMVLYPQSESRWNDCWLPSGKDTRIQKRMTKAIADYKRFEDEQAARAEAVKAEAALKTMIETQVSEVLTKLAAGEVNQDTADKLIDAIKNPPTLAAPPKAPSSARSLFIALYKLTDGKSVELRDFLIDAFRSVGYANDDINKWITDSRK